MQKWDKLFKPNFPFIKSRISLIGHCRQNKTNARFDEWEIWFEKLVPFLHDGVILVGHSLGGTFLTKYLSENQFEKKIKSVFLVAAVYDNHKEGYSLASFTLPKKLNLQTENIYLFHSKDDPLVPLTA